MQDEICICHTPNELFFLIILALLCCTQNEMVFLFLVIMKLINTMSFISSFTFLTIYVNQNPYNVVMTPRWKKQANLDVEFQIFIHLVDVGENVAHDARNDALKVVIVQDTLKKIQGRSMDIHLNN